MGAANRIPPRAVCSPMGSTATQRAGRRLLSAVERILAPPWEIEARVERAASALGTPPAPAAEAERRLVAARLIAASSSRSALAGGACAVPATLLPGAGTLLAGVGGAAADLAWMLKLEVELAMALTALHGFELDDEAERRRAYLLAAVQTWEVETGRSLAADLLDVEATACARYGPRQVTKVLVSLLGEIAIRSASRRLARAAPLIGIVVAGSMNKALTTRVGWSCHEQLERRRRLDCESAHDLILEKRAP